MPAVMPALVAGTLSSGSYSRLVEQRLVDGRQFGVVAQRGDDRVRHRDRADVTRLGRPHRGLRGANDVGTGPVVRPRGGVQAVADGDRHQLVVGGVVLDLVDAVAVAVVGVQDWLVAVGEFAPALRLRAAGERPEFGDLVEAPFAALADQRLGQYR